MHGVIQLQDVGTRNRGYIPSVLAASDPFVLWTCKDNPQPHMNSSVDKILLVIIKEEQTVVYCSLFISSIKGRSWNPLLPLSYNKLKIMQMVLKKGNKLPVLLQLNPSFHPAETADKCMLRQPQKWKWERIKCKSIAYQTDNHIFYFIHVWSNVLDFQLCTSNLNEGGIWDYKH